eukprot:CAMPEP_0202338984 /NCGR_PEP_ID=MMETSP1126-20121109/1039_1 /ASSEMBLY_ACC=CAM_ASM_000457 /TAXON_ID=3047 /ORGANISM="Dunaliella tertiolecta, Strain CCMP1320" /LENGTH=318 /DNA_ID=CAMNT_0048929467 /DNA_START=158 /DNA_END=1114 /DNA_ORIENTATION=+
MSHLLAPLSAVAAKGSSCSLGECFMLFGIIHQLTTDLETISAIASQVVRDFAEDNVVYLELRTTPKEREGMTKESYVRAVLDGIACASAQLRSQQVESNGHSSSCVPDILVKLLLSIDRREGPHEAMQTVEVAKQFMGCGVVGIDLSGNPSTGVWESWLPALVEARKAGLKITLHGGEVPGRSKEAMQQLAFCPDRLGHMCYMEDNVKEALLASKIPLELCLTSNIKTQTFPCFQDHHFREVFFAQHPLVICTDDSGVFHTSLSQEYAIAMHTFGIHERDIQRLVADSIDYTFTSDAEKLELKRRIHPQLSMLICKSS